MKNMKINSVKLINAGSKGLEVKYALPNNKDREYKDDTITHKRKAPIHEDLEKTFSWLRGHLLDICGYSMETREKDIIETEMVSVTYNDNGFVIVGKKNILEGDKTINLVTPLISDPSEYAEFGKVCSILDGIYDETKAYMAGEKTFSDEQFVLKFKSDDEDFNEEEFKKLSAEEKRDFCTKVLQDLGHLVVHTDEMVEATDEDFEEEATPEYQKVPEFVEKDLSEERGIIETPPVAEEKVPAVELVKENDGNFSIVMNNIPVKESTAKKKTKAA